MNRGGCVSRRRPVSGARLSVPTLPRKAFEPTILPKVRRAGSRLLRDQERHHIEVRPDLYDLVERLKPYSRRLRALVQVRIPDTQAAREHMDQVLSALVEEILAEQGIDASGVLGPVAAPPVDAKLARKDPAGAVFDVLACPAYCETSLFDDQLWRVSRVGGYVPLSKWLTATIREAYRVAVPLVPRLFVRSPEELHGAYVRGEAAFAESQADPHSHGLAVDVVHGRYGTELPPEGWAFVHALGGRVAKDVQLDVVVPRPAAEPWHWEVARWEELLPTLAWADFVPTNQPSKSPPGEVRMLLDFYGIRDEPFTGHREDSYPQEIDPDESEAAGES